MKIGIIGATGNAGRAVYAEAVRRGHQVTALIRDAERAVSILGPSVPTLVKDAFMLDADDLRRFDVVVNAFSPGLTRPYLHVDLATRLVALLRETTSPRLFFIVGAGSLTTGSDHHRFVDDLRGTPGAESWIATPENQLKELHFLQGVDDVDWVAVSPSRDFVPGEATSFVLGRDELLIAPDGSSRVTTGTMAVAILDEVEHPTHIRERFTVRNTSRSRHRRWNRRCVRAAARSVSCRGSGWLVLRGWLGVGRRAGWRGLRS